jgi:TonB family protein
MAMGLGTKVSIIVVSPGVTRSSQVSSTLYRAEAVMPAVPQKIRTGLVELRTHSGSVYVSPSFWERIYLLWTFRNFKSLPKQVLNRHQQQLIDKLCRAAIVSRNGPIARTSIIGAVENVYLTADCKTEAAAPTSKLVEMRTTSADVAVSRVVGSEGISIRLNRAGYNRIDVGRFPRQSGNVQHISAPKQDSAEQSETKEASPASVDSDARRTRSRNRLGWALVAACGAVLLGILFYFREGRLAPPITVPQVAIETHEPASGSNPSAAVAQPEKVQQSMPAERRQPATIIAFKPPSAAVSSRQHESRHRKAVILSQPPVTTMDSTPQERLQVAEAPESGFSYPVAPNPTLTGKVSLKAVIGTDGTVTEVDVLSGNHALAGAAVRAVRHWRYRPHELKGDAVEAETRIVISFVSVDAVSISFPAAH